MTRPILAFGLAAWLLAGQEGPRVYEANDVQKKPNILQRIEPGYTEEARRAKIAGRVQLNLIVSADGIPQQITVKRGAGFGLDEKSIEAVSRWRFAPAERNGEKVAIKATVETSFRLLNVDTWSRLTFDLPPGATRPLLQKGVGVELEDKTSTPVRVDFELDEKGVPQNVVGSAGGEKFEGTVRHWRFHPAEVSGQAVRVSGHYEATR